MQFGKLIFPIQVTNLFYDFKRKQKQVGIIIMQASENANDSKVDMEHISAEL